MPTERKRQRRKPDLDAVEALASETLTSPRVLTPQVLDSLIAHHEVTGDSVVGWLREELERLESYELDLLLSPLFTPDFDMRVRFEEVLEEGRLESDEVEGLIERLIFANLPLALLHEGERIDASLPEVVIERFVRMLHLDAPVPGDALAAFGPLSPKVRCSLRDRAWKRRQSRELLPYLLQAAHSIGEDFEDYVYFLTDFVRSHRPAARQDCLTFLDNLAEAYEADLRKHESGSRSFFNDELKASYAGKWSVDEGVVVAHKRMIAMARALHNALS